MNHETIKNKITDLIAFAGFSKEEVTVALDEKSNTIWFAINSNNTRLLLGRDAEALLALNHLAVKVVEKLTEEGAVAPQVIIDANDFQKKKIENLKTVAHMMAERARYFKSSIDVDPMPARERKIVHEFLSEMSDIQTESVGMGKDRHIVIKYVDSKL
jgi:spoIIIJ-associated protein